MKPIALFMRSASLLALAFLSETAGAGAWDVGSFDNDDALDLVWELEASSDLSALEAALGGAASDDAYIDSPAGSAAIAAAEVVAALLGKPHAQLPDELAAWVEGRKLAGNDELVGLARQAVRNVQNLDKSELAQLWSETGEGYEDWASGLADLARRLR